MRLTFEHPAVVTGTWENGHVRRELVRVPAEFEIAEYTDAEAPLSFTIVDDETGDVMQSFRTVGGRHYKAWRWDKPDYVFYSESSLMDSIYTGAQFEFDGLGDVLGNEIKRVAKVTRYRNIENAERKPLKREQNCGFNAHAISCKKAPALKRWQWLGPDTAEEVRDWHARTSAVLSKIVIIDGVPHILSHEPCYRLTASGTSRANRSGGASVGVESVAIFGGDLDGPVYDRDTGLENLSHMALSLGDQYFAANDTDGMRQFAEDSGWGIAAKSGQTIKVYNPEAVSPDFMEMETVRHARIVYDRARLMAGHVKIEDGGAGYFGKTVAPGNMARKMERLRLAILDWQRDRNGTDQLYGPSEDLLAEMVHWEEGRQQINGFGLLDQIKALKVREDMADVTVIPKPWSGPSP